MTEIEVIPLENQARALLPKLDGIGLKLRREIAGVLNAVIFRGNKASAATAGTRARLIADAIRATSDPKKQTVNEEIAALLEMVVKYEAAVLPATLKEIGDRVAEWSNTPPTRAQEDRETLFGAVRFLFSVRDRWADGPGAKIENAYAKLMELGIHAPDLEQLAGKVADGFLSLRTTVNNEARSRGLLRDKLADVGIADAGAPFDALVCKLADAYQELRTQHADLLAQVKTPVEGLEEIEAQHLKLVGSLAVTDKYEELPMRWRDAHIHRGELITIAKRQRAQLQRWVELMDYEDADAAAGAHRSAHAVHMAVLKERDRLQLENRAAMLELERLRKKIATCEMPISGLLEIARRAMVAHQKMLGEPAASRAPDFGAAARQEALAEIPGYDVDVLIAALWQCTKDRDEQRAEVARLQGQHWLVVRVRETDPPEAWGFGSDEQQAREFYARASEQWTETFLCRVEAGPGQPQPALSMYPLFAEMAQLRDELKDVRDVLRIERNDHNATIAKLRIIENTNPGDAEAGVALVRKMQEERNKFEGWWQQAAHQRAGYAAEIRTLRARIGELLAMELRAARYLAEVATLRGEVDKLGRDRAKLTASQGSLRFEIADLIRALWYYRACVREQKLTEQYPLIEEWERSSGGRFPFPPPMSTMEAR